MSLSQAPNPGVAGRKATSEKNHPKSTLNRQEICSQISETSQPTPFALRTKAYHCFERTACLAHLCGALYEYTTSPQIKLIQVATASSVIATCGRDISTSSLLADFAFLYKPDSGF